MVEFLESERLGNIKLQLMTTRRQRSGKSSAKVREPPSPLPFPWEYEKWTPVFIEPTVDVKGDTTHDPRCEIRIATYNVLAEQNVDEKRFERIMPSVLQLNADLLCIQEIQRYEEKIKGAFESSGYHNLHYARPNKKLGGCGIFYRPSKLSLLETQNINYNILAPENLPGDNGADCPYSQRAADTNDVRMSLEKNDVAILAAFRITAAPDVILLAASTHIFWDPVLIEVKFLQIQHLAHCVLCFLKKVVEKYERTPLVFLGGDFNSLPGDPVYNYITSNAGHAGRAGPIVSAKYLQEKFQAVLKDLAGETDPDKAAMDYSLDWCCGFQNFPLPVASLYKFANGKEPWSTNFTERGNVTFMGTLDYIFFIPSPHQWNIKTLIELPPDGSVLLVPNQNHPSDHFPVGADFEIY